MRVTTTIDRKHVDVDCPACRRRMGRVVHEIGKGATARPCGLPSRLPAGRSGPCAGRDAFAEGGMKKHTYPLGMAGLAVLAFVMAVPLSPQPLAIGTAQSGPICEAPAPEGGR